MVRSAERGSRGSDATNRASVRAVRSGHQVGRARAKSLIAPFISSPTTPLNAGPRAATPGKRRLTDHQKVSTSNYKVIQEDKSVEKNIALPFPVDLFLRLAQFLRDEEDPRDPVTAAWDAIGYWIDNASWKPELLARKPELASRGYTWKYKDRCLFLPHGTQIRMPHKGKYFYAAVEDDEIRYEGQTMTPGQLANFIAQGSRNAWICLWVKRPNDKDWKLADHLSPASGNRELADSLLEGLK